MTDRELLELAAKSAGNPRGTSVAGGGLLMANDLYWNPLIDDGDALRLAVKLRLSVNIEEATVNVYDWDSKMTQVWASEYSDANEATRRAVVRAAAELGKK
jgi:hypothetical protein